MTKIKVKQYLPTNPALQEALEGKIQPKEISPIQETTRNKESQSSKSRGEKHTHIHTHHSKIQKSMNTSHGDHSRSEVSNLPINTQTQQNGCENSCTQGTDLSTKDRHHLRIKDGKGIPSTWT